MNLKCSEIQEQLEDNLAKLNSSERQKHSLQEQLDILSVDLEKVERGEC
jgi:hypothetical protein